MLVPGGGRNWGRAVASRSRPRYWCGVDGDVVWSRRLADELWSGVVTPLTFTLLADVMAEHMVRRRLALAGLDAGAGAPVFRLAGGHVYVNASLVADVMCELPAAVVTDGLLRLLPERLRERVRRDARPTLSPHVLGTILHLTWRERGWMPWSRATAFREEAARVTRELEVRGDPGALAPPEIAARIAFLQHRLGDYLEVVSWAMIYAYVFFHLTAQLLERWGGGVDIALLLRGVSGIRTFEIHDELAACAAIARRDPELRAALLAADPAAVAAASRAGDFGEVGARLRALVDRHGHRLVARDLACPSWREHPAAVVESLRALLLATPQPERGDDAQAASRAETEVLARVGGGLGGTARRELLRMCLRWCREYYAVRENMRYHADLFLAALRELALAAARHLGVEGMLEASEDVFYLTADELLAALDTARDQGELGARARARRREYDAHRFATPPDVLVGDRLERDEPVRPDADATAAGRSLLGIGVSPGRAAGTARVVRGVDDLESVRQGEIIVAASTDPSWTSLLSLGGALVLEAGGMLSHGAIVARALGIPAVADVARATTLLRTGDRVTVDGGSGRVAVAGV
jgi:phosphohistidine swiveling domain-containing protein